jgi:hypothetical protein
VDSEGGKWGKKKEKEKKIGGRVNPSGAKTILS